MAVFDFEESSGAPGPGVLQIALPAGISLEVQQAMQVAVNKAAQVLGPKLVHDADRLATLLVELAEPTSALIQERMQRRRVISTLIQKTEWVSALELQQSVVAHARAVADWKRRGRIIGVMGADGRDLYPAYQFDAAMRPLPIVADILKRFGAVSDPWHVIAWFHTRNVWLLRHHVNFREFIAPKDCLHDTKALHLALTLRDRKAEALDIRPPPAP
ncbi:hypothetical protein [Pigmentiphaga litoralis]|uniref:Uncharacterized protein n=1 Tax=Pigmentiphaga litoralis TaxID=516702 RepID=A0A7Y9ISU8_9BURK|nr:hypothetical protein [Pigmentiphaga litoralis]NYE24102.1 hypothetical protein [Pigmentiphaga litoralis]NYE82284.1 hypothetical protein [Pigmentiphaga litoralis]